MKIPEKFTYDLSDSDKENFVIIFDKMSVFRKSHIYQIVVSKGIQALRDELDGGAGGAAE